MIIKMTYDEYDAMMERIEAFGLKASELGSFWPSPETMKKKFTIKSKTDIEFIQWLLATNDDPFDEEEKKSKKYLLKLMYDNLEFV